MLIFRYFKCVATCNKPDENEDEELPEPTGLFSKSVPTKAIKLASA